MDSSWWYITKQISTCPIIYKFHGTNISSQNCQRPGFAVIEELSLYIIKSLLKHLENVKDGDLLYIITSAFEPIVNNAEKFEKLETFFCFSCHFFVTSVKIYPKQFICVLIQIFIFKKINKLLSIHIKASIFDIKQRKLFHTFNIISNPWGEYNITIAHSECLFSHFLCEHCTIVTLQIYKVNINNTIWVCYFLFNTR